MTKCSMLVSMFAIGLSAAAFAKDADPRLASVRKAWIEPIDEIGDDKPIAVCVAENINKTTPIVAVPTKAEADAVIRVHATSKKSSIAVYLADGTTKVWAEDVGQKAGFGLIMIKLDACGQAERLLDELTKAMKKARDKSK